MPRPTRTLDSVAFRKRHRRPGLLVAVGCAVVLLTGACGTDTTAVSPVTEPPRRAETLDEATLVAEALAVLLADTGVSDPLGGDELDVVGGFPVYDEEGLIGWSLQIAVPGTGDRDAVWLGTRCESDGRIIINRREATLRPPVTVGVAVDVDTAQVIDTHIPPQTTVPGDDERPSGGVRTGETIDRTDWTGRRCDPNAPTD